ncbi:MAG: hypothetical protein CMP37_00635 [Rickettsiales bacterium]|nr:hypothetical protein [Rickettsiales bacterium]OUW72915.1 MAG: hypothetical protein CBD71_00675 [Rickettsiales bacterium TMED211]
MKKEIEELSQLLEKLIDKKTLEIDSKLESRFYDLVEKIKVLNNETKSDKETPSLDIEHINKLLEKILNKQKKNSSLFEEFKNYLEKKNKKSL